VGNAFGLYDLHGNVWEWCADHWHSNYEGAPTDGSAWLTENENQSRLLRGGSWVYLPRDCRSAYRHRGHPDHRYSGVGFRVASATARTLV
jgi:formylglycine-generating enzyme required for sulfatase activity